MNARIGRPIDLALQHLVGAIRDASRAVGAAERDTTTHPSEFRRLMDLESGAVAALEAFLAPIDPEGPGEVVRDFYQCLHGEHGLLLQIRAQQALGRQEVPIEMDGGAWRKWRSIRAAILKDEVASR
jgi:hypothetical protein